MTKKQIRHRLEEVKTKLRKLRELVERQEKGLQQQIDTIKFNKSKIAPLEGELYELNQKLKNKDYDEEVVTISDHAIVRYLERVVGMDIEAIKKEIWPMGYLDIRGLKSVPVNRKDGSYSHSVKIQEDCITTILSHKEKE